MEPKASIEADALFTVLYVAMNKTAFTSMLTKDAKLGLAKDLNDKVFEHLGIDSDGRWLDALKGN